MLVSMIAAVAKNRVIGRENRLPWYLPEDLKYFKQTTLGSPVVMGRKTYESIGRLLPGRPHWILSRNPSFQVSGARVVSDLDQALSEIATNYPDSEVFILGGGVLYSEALARKKVDRLYLTEIAEEIEGDAFFPEWDREEFFEVRSSPLEMSSQSRLHYRFVLYEKKSG